MIAILIFMPASKTAPSARNWSITKRKERNYPRWNEGKEKAYDDDILVEMSLLITFVWRLFESPFGEECTMRLYEYE